ncbi:MAG: xanthine dehydrogenase family protein molybdopterin-binding subunit, partial [Sphingobacteriaceae bacterium]|nr:xanthine dehydrogenase family protein molybdopterin-binding subunit [Cytophagaceae bacterium]
MSIQPVSRRRFLQTTAASGALLALGFALPAQAGQEAVLQKVEPLGIGTELGPYILLDQNGKITFVNPKPDVGQGIGQAMAALLAEELDVPLETVIIVQSNGLAKYGGQGVGGSNSVRSRWLPMRKAGAAAREMLVQAASARWAVPVEECSTENGRVLHKTSGKSLGYGELVAEAAKLEIPKSPALKDPKAFKILGKPLPKPDVPLKVTGQAVYGIDVDVPGMLYASIERSPVIHGKVASFDASAALKVPGVKQVLQAERDIRFKTVETVAVLATSYWAATQGRKALKVVWEKSDHASVSTDAYFATLRELSQQPGNDYPGNAGDFTKTFTEAPKKLEAAYQTPFLAHVPMEPECATVWVKPDGAEVWASVQSPDGVIRELAPYLGLKPEQIKVTVPFVGGAFGRKSYTDFVKEAAFLSKKTGKPVKVIWSREDDLTQGPFRPGMLNVLQGGLDAAGNVMAFHHKIVGGSLGHQNFKQNFKTKADSWASEGMNHEDSPLGIPNVRRSHVLAETDIPITFWRSVYASTNVFGHESFIDELAHAAGKDPLDFRLSLFKNEPRFLKVLETAAEKSGYREPLPAGKARGLAIAKSFGTIYAHVVTVARGKEGIQI